MELFERLARKHFTESPPDKAVLCLEIWAEATRNPAIGEMAIEFEHDVTSRLTELLRNAKSCGAIPAEVDPAAVAILIAMLADGLFIRRAILPDFNPEREVGHVIALIGAMLRGGMSPGLGSSGAESSS
jgi:TetR/AcrR family transcriptional repressor of uid operon